MQWERRLHPPDRLIWSLKASGSWSLGGDKLRHRAMIGDGPAVLHRRIPGGSGGLDLVPGAVSGKPITASHGRAQAPQLLQVASE
jgi:hypothetical protein